MVIRDLTLRSAASFGSFHLIRLLYDEYMFYLIEHKVAAATEKSPIAVMGEVSLLLCSRQFDQAYIEILIKFGVKALSDHLYPHVSLSTDLILLFHIFPKLLILITTNIFSLLALVQILLLP